MTNYKLEYHHFSGEQSLVNFVSEHNITPRQIQSIIYEPGHYSSYILFYWRKKHD